VAGDATRKQTYKGGAKIFLERAKYVGGGAKYNKYNKINNNSENFRGT